MYVDVPYSKFKWVFCSCFLFGILHVLILNFPEEKQHRRSVISPKPPPHLLFSSPLHHVVADMETFTLSCMLLLDE